MARLANCDPAFLPRLQATALDELERAEHTVYALWPDFRLAYHNPAWHRFARENGADPTFAERWKLGCRVMDAVPEVVRPFYRAFFQSVLNAPSHVLHPVRHEYECSSATLLRRFVMTVRALPESGGLITVNTLVLEQPHDPLERPPCPPRTEAYTALDGLVHQCVHCRRVRHGHELVRWDWVPDWVTHVPANVCHTLCETCSAGYARR